MPQRVRTTSSLPRRAALRLEWLEDRRVPSLFGLLSGVTSQVPLLSALAPARPPASASAPPPELPSSLAAGVGLQATVGVALGGVKLNLASAVSVNEGGATLSANLSAGVSVVPSVALTVNAGPTAAGEPAAPVAMELVATPAAGGGQGAGVVAPMPSLPGPLALPAGVAVKSEGAPAAAAGVALAGRGAPSAGQPGAPPSPPALTGSPAAVGPAVPAGPAAGPLLTPASAILPTAATLLTAGAPPHAGSGGAEAAPSETVAGALPPLAPVVPARMGPAGPARSESGAAEEEEGAAPGPDGSGPATDLSPDGLTAGAVGADAVSERAALEAGDGPDYWRLAPWATGLATALVGAEAVRRRRRAAAEAARAGALPAAEFLLGLPGPWPGEDG